MIVKGLKICLHQLIIFLENIIFETKLNFRKPEKIKEFFHNPYFFIQSTFGSDMIDKGQEYEINLKMTCSEIQLKKISNHSDANS